MMNKYLLDTNIISYLNDSNSPFCQAVRLKINSMPDQDEILISVLTLYEHHYGVAKAKATGYNNPVIIDRLNVTDNMISNMFTVISLPIKGAELFGELKNMYRERMEQARTKKKLARDLERINIDLMLAGSALAENAIFVSNDNIFEEIKEMRPDFLLEDWTK
ncbi:MAG: PIN domain-containing protein [Deltaproteobacteria bacterium]|nr:PIN domain-containing protein [Deltaproteobacteria bacterium]